MKNEIKKEIESLDKAYKAKLIGTDEYCTMLNTLLKKLKNESN